MTAADRHSRRDTPQHRGVRIEISPENLFKLLKDGSLCAADFRCLDCDSKNCLLGLVLKACAANLDNDRIASESDCGGAILSTASPIQQAGRKSSPHIA